jgi:nitroimidazol reductase NimA-like FMN-containing flavoprotein (pyridoxamine 5'-phosphate oxidase superfamily)
MIIAEMTPAECFALLQETGFGRLACARSGQPYVVPIYFAVNKSHIYSFSTLGKKIEWMRANPLVCVEVDEVILPSQWRSVVVAGRYQELPDKRQWAAIRNHAHSVLEKRASWWEPAYVSSTHQEKSHSAEPIFYRIRIDEITGHRAQPDEHELATMAHPLDPPHPESGLATWVLRAARNATPIDATNVASRFN